jgi:hypothetical protein
VHQAGLTGVLTQPETAFVSQLILNASDEVADDTVSYKEAVPAP